jgi:hypothetical protein
LNPLWQITYLDLIRDWTGVAANADKCQILMTSHNPLTIAALEKEEVRVMFADGSGTVSVSEPYTDPKGMGFTATLTESLGCLQALIPTPSVKSTNETHSPALITARRYKKHNS